jgi:hypothetical protein
MPEPTAPHASVRTTRPQPVLDDSAPARWPDPAAPRQRELRIRISGMRDALVGGALVMAAAGTARITQFRQVIRRKSGSG